MDYTHYGVEELVMDSFFKAWVLQRPGADNEFWEKFIAEHPEKQNEIKEAINIILLLNDYFHEDENE
jgi:hypothetical protein